MTTVPIGAEDHGADRTRGLWLRTFTDPDGISTRPVLTNLKVAGRKGSSDRARTWLRVAMAALGVLALTAAVVSYQAQYVMIYAYKGVRVIAALQAGIPDAAALVFASLGIALALTGKRAIRARVLNVAAVATSIVMNLLAASAGWKAMAVWVLAPVAYAVTSDTLIGVLRSWTMARQREINADLAEDDSTPLAVLGKAVLYTARFAVAPRSTAKGARQAILNAAPVPSAPQPERPVMFPLPVIGATQPVTARPEPAALPPARTRRTGATRSGQSTSKATGNRVTKKSQLIKLATDKHGLTELPLDAVSKLATRLAAEVGMNAGTARRELIAHARTLQNGRAL